MKNMKKILALLVAVLMIVASVSAFAEEKTNAGTLNATSVSTSDASLTISGLDAGDVVNFYKVMEWKTNTGWDFTDAFKAIANEGKGLKDSVVIGSTAAEGTAGIAADVKTYIIGKPATYSTNPATGAATKNADAVPGRINSSLAAEIAKLKPNTYTYTETVGTSATSVTHSNPEPGLYMALINPKTPGTIYNPVFVAADYAIDANGKLAGMDVAQSSSWEVSAVTDSYSDNAIAKKKTITVDKKVTDIDKTVPTGNNADADEGTTTKVGEIVKYTVKTTMPEYADSYTWAKFDIKDTLTGLKLVVDGNHPVEVMVGTVGATLGENDKVNKGDATYSLTAENDTTDLMVSFKTAYILDQSAAKDVWVTYYAKVTDTAVKNVNPEKNVVTVEFSNNPDDSTDYGILKDITNEYTFSIDAGLFGNDEYETSELIKIGLDKDGNLLTEKHTYNNTVNTAPLAGAVFGLFTAADKATAAIGKDATALQDAEGIYKNALYEHGAILTSDNYGKLNIKGLDVGTYYLVETKAPDGFIADTTVREITISAKMKDMSNTETLKGREVTYTTKVLDEYSVAVKTGNETITSTYTMTYGQNTTDLPTGKITLTNSSKHDTTTPDSDRSTLIANTQGTALPSTGGMGTTILYIGGSILVILAAVLLITKRRMNAED
ncbi:MAG: LPXTG cell wall anchor domain-containing protein [Oscillospiraceae bacterium]|nr:LPXTG cell wall anchor domain-containing protein [Oscillospiraceae bacterium]